MKKSMMPLVLLALSLCTDLHAAATERYRNDVVKMKCGAANYTLKSTCIKSEDAMSMNECKPQSLMIETAAGKRSATLPELPKEEAGTIRASGRDLKSLFVVAWACTDAGSGPIATLRYSAGGGSGEYSEAWSHYDEAGNLVIAASKLTPGQVRAVERNFKAVPSIMPNP